jgi:putative sigma-54 modulation protein
MDITVTFRKMEPIESLKEYAVEKVSKLKKYLEDPMEAHVVLSVEKFRHSADVTLSVNGARVKGVEETGDMYSAIDQVMDKIEKQVKRHLEKVKSRRSDSVRGAGEGVGEEDEAGAPLSDETEIEVEKIFAKPMDPEEAAMQLRLSNQDFLVFRNAKSREVNVIYKRKGERLRLIEPAA